MNLLMTKRQLPVLAVVFFLILFATAVAEGARSPRYSVELKGPLPLVVGQSCTIVGTVRVNGAIARNLSFGVRDDAGQMSLAAKTNYSGKFSFKSRPLKAGKAKITFIFGKQEIVNYVTVFSSPLALFRSTKTPGRYLDYYRLNVCKKANPLIRCKTVNGAIFCGTEGSTMSYCGRDSALPDGKVVKATFNAIKNKQVRLSKDQCFSDCYMKNYMKSLESASPSAAAFCNAQCRYAGDNEGGGGFWHLMWAFFN